MSEGSITYQVEDQECGVRTVINSQLRNHLVCNDGLACMRTNIGDEVEIKQCQSVKIISGERCVPRYDNCYGTLDCLLSPLGTYTCGGELPWTGNELYVQSGYVKPSEYSINMPLIASGACVLFVYLSGIAWLYVRDYRYDDDDESIYPDKTDTGERIGDGGSKHVF